jgi:hypothetical protein
MEGIEPPSVIHIIFRLLEFIETLFNNYSDLLNAQSRESY